MTLKHRLLLWLGSIFAAVFAAVVLAPVVGPTWTPSALVSAGFAYFAVAFAPAGWALLSIPCFVATVVAINYAVLRGFDLQAWVFVGLVAALNTGLYVYGKRSGYIGDLKK